MPNIEIDFSDVQSATPVTPGWYQGVIDSVTWYHKEDKEHPSLDWVIKGVDEAVDGREFHTYTGLGPKALWKLKDQFASLGVDSSGVLNLEVDDGTGLVLNPDFTGMPVEFKVINETYEGRVISKMADLRAPSNNGAPTTSSGPQPAATSSAKSPFKAGGGRTFK